MLHMHVWIKMESMHFSPFLLLRMANNPGHLQSKQKIVNGREKADQLGLLGPKEGML